MRRTGRQQERAWRTSVRRVAATTLAIGALSAMALAPGADAATTSQTTATTISAAKAGKFGTVLTAGNTVYTLKPSKVACTAKCLKAWPPVLLPAGVTAPTAGTGVDQSKLGTVSVAGGNLQITYGGKALYWFIKDKAPGQVKGNIKDKWGKWATVVTAKGSGSSSGSGGGSKTNAGTGGSSF